MTEIENIVTFSEVFFLYNLALKLNFVALLRYKQNPLNTRHALDVDIAFLTET